MQVSFSNFTLEKCARCHDWHVCWWQKEADQWSWCPLLIQWPILQVCLRVLHWIYNGETHKWSISNSPDQIMPHVHPEQWLWFRLWLDLDCSYKVCMYAYLCYWKWRSFYQICGRISVCTQWPTVLYSLSCGVNHKLTTALSTMWVCVHVQI